MQHKKLPENLAQLSALLGFTATFFPSIITGANLLAVLLQSLLIAIVLGGVIWAATRMFLKWQMEQLKPVLEEIEVPAPSPAPISASRRRSGRFNSVRIKDKS